MSVELCVTWSSYFYNFCFFELFEEAPGVRKAAIMQKIPGKSWQQTKRGFLSRGREESLDQNLRKRKPTNLHLSAYIIIIDEIEENEV